MLFATEMFRTEYGVPPPQACAVCPRVPPCTWPGVSRGPWICISETQARDPKAQQKGLPLTWHIFNWKLVQLPPRKQSGRWNVDSHISPAGRCWSSCLTTLPHLGKEMTSQTQNSSSHEMKHSEVQAIRAKLRNENKLK